MKTINTNKIGIQEQYFHDVGSHVQKIAYASHVISTLLHNSETAKENGGQSFNCYQSGGLLVAMELLANELSMVGERIESTPESIRETEGLQ